jgi:Bacterial membrane protein YfhO
VEGWLVEPLESRSPGARAHTSRHQMHVTRPKPQIEPSADSDERRPSRTSRAPLIVACLAGLALVIGTIGPPLFGRGVFLASDLLYDGYPWRALQDPTALGAHLSGPVSDTIDAGYPDRATFAEQLRDGMFTDWNPWVAGGQPLGGSGVLGPLAFLSFVLLPSWYAPAAVKVLGMAVSIGFTYLFCRRLGTQRVPAVLAGLAFAGSGFMVMWTNWPQVDVAAFIPALFWATERFLQRRTASSAIPIALALAAMLLANFPAVVGYTLYLLVPYVAVRLLVNRGRHLPDVVKGGVGTAGALLAGGLLVAAVLLPFAARLGDNDLDYRQQSPDSHLIVPTLMTTVVPDAFGISSERQIYSGGRNQVEAISFVGVTIALLATLGVALPLAPGVQRGARATFVAGTLVIGVATFAGGPLLDLLQELPVFSDSFIGRTRSILGFTVAVLAAFGLQALIERRSAWTRGRRAWFAVVMAASGAVTLYVGARTVQRVRPLGGGEILKDSLVLPVVLGAAAVLTVLVIRFGRQPLRSLAVGLLPVLFTIEALALAGSLLPNESRDTLYPETAVTRFLQDNVGHERVAVQGNLTYYGNAGMLAGLRIPTGHAFYSQNWKDVLGIVDPQAFALSPTYPGLRANPDVVGAAALDRLGVSWFATTPDTAPFGERESLALGGASCPAPSTGDATVVGQGSDLDVTIPAGTGLRGVVLRLCDDTALPTGSTLVVGATHAGDTATSTQHLRGTLRAGEFVVAIPGDELVGDGGIELAVSLEGAADASLQLASTPDGGLAVDAVRPTDDGLRLAFAGELRVYERTMALPRIRWASRAEVIENEHDRLRRVDSHDTPDDTVVLSEGPSGGSGLPGDVEVVVDDPDQIKVNVDARGDGYLVIADALQDDWVARLDGEGTELVDADYAGVAVAVPAGRHEIVLRAAPRGQTAGVAIGGLTALGLAIVGIMSLRHQRRRAADGATAPDLLAGAVNGNGAVPMSTNNPSTASDLPHRCDHEVPADRPAQRPTEP